MSSIDATQLTVSMSPHVRGGLTVERMMADIIIALLPAAVAGVVLFGVPALITVLLSTATAVAVEAVIEKLTGRELTITDLHAVVIGLLTGLLMPSTAPWWLTMTGAGTAMILGKMVFGGLGTYPFNPPLVAWVVLKLSWPERMSSFVAPFTGERVLTPLMAFAEDPSLFYAYDLGDLFLGNKAGPIGTVCGLAIAAGGIYLLIRGVIRWHIPAAFLAGLALFAWVLHLVNADFYPPVAFHVAGGGALLGALFLAPEPVTSPVTVKGMLCFGFLAGALTMILRMWGADYDGTFYAILVMNAATPLFNALAPRAYGRWERA